MKHNQMSATDRAKIKADIYAAENVADMLGILSKNFDLENCKPGPMVKNMLAHHICVSVLPAINPEVKTQSAPAPKKPAAKKTTPADSGSVTE